ISERPYITSVDLLACLLFDNDSRVQTIFKLREHFPLYNGCPPKFAKMPEPQTGPALTDDSKMILAWADMEATYLVDYWIDTEHLLLGIMHVQPSVAASYSESRVDLGCCTQVDPKQPGFSTELWPRVSLVADQDTAC